MTGHTPWRFIARKGDSRITRARKRISLFLWRHRVPGAMRALKLYAICIAYASTTIALAAVGSSYAFGGLGA